MRAFARDRANLVTTHVKQLPAEFNGMTDWFCPTCFTDCARMKLQQDNCECCVDFYAKDVELNG